jgi:ribosomal protein S18 acetylase RimI-like enzyme
MNKEGVLIRDFRKTDLDSVLDLLPRCFAKEFEISGFDPDHTRGMAKRAYGTAGRLLMASSRLFRREPLRFFVAEVGNKVVGTTIATRLEKAGSISAVMVSPDHRRKGIATTLVKSAVEYFREREMERAVLNAVSTNAAAIGVYSKLGFQPFENFAYLVGDKASVPALGGTEVETRPYRDDDLEEVYNLVMASQDPERLRIFGFSKRQLKTPLWLRLFRFSTQKRIVAVRAGRIVGSVVATYTTPKEAGNISSINVRPEDRSQGIEKALATAAINEIRRGGVERIVAMVRTKRPELIETLSGLGLREAVEMVEMLRETR